jgi:hypothetical protein
MSVLAMILTAAMVVPGDGPKMESGEVEQQLDLNGVWQGIIKYGDKTRDVIFNDSGLCVWEGGNGSLSLWEVHDEGQGRFRFVEDSRRTYAGIYEQREDYLAICYRKESEGRPASFRATDGQGLLILHRVKPRK